MGIPQAPQMHDSGSEVDARGSFFSVHCGWAFTKDTFIGKMRKIRAASDEITGCCLFTLARCVSQNKELG